MQSGKKQLELLLMNYFRECTSAFPKGKIVPSESPDFILNLKSKNRIGIELTRLNPVKVLHPETHLAGQLELREKVIATSELLVKRTSGLKLFVKFMFDDKIPVNEERELILPVQLANIIRKAVQNKNPAGFFYVVLDSPVLPVGVSRILIVNHPGLPEPVWERANNLGISEDAVEDIKHAIRKKDDKLFLYHRQNLNLYWLVIFADRLRGLKSYNLHNRIRNHTFESHFQKVFLFDLIKAHVQQIV